MPLNHRIFWIDNYCSGRDRNPLIGRALYADRFTYDDAIERTEILNRLFADRTGQFEVRRTEIY
jgi:hypothetical protein